MLFFSFFAPYFLLPNCKALLCFFMKKFNGVATIPPWLSGFDYSSFLFKVSPSFWHAFLLTSSPICFLLRLVASCDSASCHFSQISSIATSSSESSTSTPLYFALFLPFALNFSKRRLKCSLVERFVTRKWMSLFSFSLFAISCHTFPRSTVLGLKRKGSLRSTCLASWISCSSVHSKFLERKKNNTLTSCAQDVHKFPKGIYFVEEMLASEHVF